jgi:carbon-monoxide dehydrogenase medium subunit
MKHPHPASRYAVAGAAAVVEIGKDGACTGARLVIGGVTANPVPVAAAASALVGSKPDAAAIAKAAAEVAAALPDPMGDTYASGEFRVHLATVLAKRALTAAVERARG